MSNAEPDFELPTQGPFEVLIEDADAQRDEWRVVRQHGVGASELPKLLGMYPPRWGSAMSVFADKVADEPLVIEETGKMRWGKLLQDVVAEQTALALGAVWKRDERLLRSADFPVAMATLDGWHVGAERFIGEVKTTDARHLWEENAPEHDGIPAFVWAQVQQQLYVAGEDHAYCSVLFRGDAEDFYQTIKRDQRFIDDVMLPALMDFWACVESRTPPPVDGGEATTRAIKQLFAESRKDAPVVVLDAAFLDRHYEREALKQKVKEIEQRLAEIDNHFKVAIGDAEAGVIVNTDLRYSFKTQQIKEQVRKAHTRRPLIHRAPRKKRG